MIALLPPATGVTHQPAIRSGFDAFNHGNRTERFHQADQMRQGPLPGE